MPTVSIPKKNLKLDVPEGTSLKDAATNAGLPVASSCNSDGVCAKCRFLIIEGMENLSAPSDNETFLIERHKLSSNMRISCLAKVQGDVSIDASYW